MESSPFSRAFWFCSESLSYTWCVHSRFPSAGTEFLNIWEIKSCSKTLKSFNLFFKSVLIFEWAQSITWWLGLVQAFLLICFDLVRLLNVFSNLLNNFCSRDFDRSIILSSLLWPLWHTFKFVPAQLHPYLHPRVK